MGVVDSGVRGSALSRASFLATIMLGHHHVDGALGHCLDIPDAISLTLKAAKARVRPGAECATLFRSA